MASKTVRFFRPVDEHGQTVDKAPDWASWLKHIEELDDDSARVRKDGNETLGLTWRGGDLPDLLLICSVRRGASMPLLELKRRFRKVKAAKDEAVAEATHVAFLPNNVVAVLRDGHSPSHLRVAEYLNEVLKPTPILRLQPILRVNVRRKLAEVDLVQLAHFKFTSDQVRRLQQRVPRLHRLIGRMGEDYGQLVATLDLRVPGRKGYDEESSRLLEDVRSLVLNESGETPAYEEAQMSFVSTESGRMDYVDFVEERIAVAVAVDTLGEGEESAVFSPSAASAIEKAYEMVKQDLDEALKDG